MSADDITLTVRPSDIDAALDAYLLGGRLPAVCPVARRLQGEHERIVRGRARDGDTDVVGPLDDDRAAFLVTRRGADHQLQALAFLHP